MVNMPYSGHLSIAHTFSRNHLFPAMVKALYLEPLYSGHLSIVDTFSKNQCCPLLRGITVYNKGQSEHRVCEILQKFSLRRSDIWHQLLTWKNFIAHLNVQAIFKINGLLHTNNDCKKNVK